MEYSRYEDILEQVLHDLHICNIYDSVHDPFDDISGMKLSDKIRKFLDYNGYEIKEKGSDMIGSNMDDI